MQRTAIKQAIAGWNGKSADDIGAIYQQYADGAHFVDDIIALAAEPACQSGATWLLKRHFESGFNPDAKQISRIYGSLPQLADWQPKLHILQCTSYMPIAKKDSSRVERFLRECLSDNNKFVRAWAYHGFYELARQYPHYQQEAKQFFDMAMKDEAASVKARVRAVLKKGFD